MGGKGCWHISSERAPWSPKDSAGEAVFDGKAWILGAYAPERVTDLWFSEDCVRWEFAGQGLEGSIPI